MVPYMRFFIPDKEVIFSVVLVCLFVSNVIQKL